jgi:formylglycine-generating enzyme required for sulfatase activity
MSTTSELPPSGEFGAMFCSIIAMVVSTACLHAYDPRHGRATGHADYVESIAGTKVEFSMVAIRGGTFLLGSPIREPGRKDNEGPRHKVELRPFWMGKFEVTWDEYDVYCHEREQRDKQEFIRSPRQRAADAVTKPTQSYIDQTYGFGAERYPAFNMSHHAAMKYCEWLSAKTGRTYRLPTEAEWEYACRAGTTSAYPFGDKPQELAEYAWYSANSKTADFFMGKTNPVGRKLPNRWGLHDMLGNVAEWCLDQYDPDFYDSLPWDRTPLGPVNLPGPYRYPHVARGGSYRSPAPDCRSAARMSSEKAWNKADPCEPPSIWWLVPGKWVGFRIVRPVEEYPALTGIKSKVTLESK